jgi:trehalose-phosphatase
MSDAEIAGADAAVRKLRARRRLLLLLDFDGTLTEFNPDPEVVQLPDARRDLLVELAEGPDTTLGIVSGRRLDDVRRRTRLPAGVWYSGLHGLEIEGPGVRFMHPDAEKAFTVLRRLAPGLSSDLAVLPGVFLEDKTLSLVAHFRDASPEDAKRVPGIVDEHARPYLDSGLFRLMHGACMLELLPRIDWNKGSAVGWIRERVASDRETATVYVGDDVTDEDAFTAVRGHGLSVAASPRAKGADFQVDGPVEVEELLRRLVAGPRSAGP